MLLMSLLQLSNAVGGRVADSPARFFGQMGLKSRPAPSIVLAVVEAASDRRFDQNIATLLEIAQEHSLEALLQRLIRGAMERAELAGVQFWLVDKGDRCPVCPKRSKCVDQTRCLHLIAEADRSSFDSGASHGRFDETRARMPLGVSLVGRVAATGRQMNLRGVDEISEELAGFEWRGREEIRGINGTPITFKGEVLGVGCALFGEEMPDDVLPWGRIFADRIGAAIANARAFEEIRRLKAQLEQQNTYLEEEVVEAKAFGALVGQSVSLRQIIRQIDLVAPTEASVLILGDTGTGKELVAREIHRRSNRRDGPLVRVNCASIPKDLFESEFFGHVRGAFTGAVKDRAGRFEAAERGTLFLDEIGEVPLEMQGKLLRVLQEKLYERVGEDRTRSADVRIIAATNRDLEKAIAGGRFREDLYYRLHVFPIQVTALKERQEDIPLLAQRFVELAAKELKCPRPRLTLAAIRRLQAYHWPGNIRELRNVIERAVILAQGGPLRFDLPVGDSPPARLEAASMAGSARGDAGRGFLTEAEMRCRERENLVAVLERAGWRVKGVGGAAELLGVKPATLQSRMKKMGVRKTAAGK